MKVKRGARVFLLVLGCISAAQNLVLAPNEEQFPFRSDTVLEVTAVDFDIAWQQEYLYLKVQSDGTMRSQIVNRMSGDRRFEKAEVVDVKRTLSTAELRQLKMVLARGDTLRLKHTYKPGKVVVPDTGTWWDIQIPRANQTQKIHVVAFSPYAANAMKPPYPGALLALGCAIEKLRADTIGQKLDPETEDECGKVFPAN